MVIGLLEAAFNLPESSSLKDKRSVLRSLRDRFTARMNVSTAEIGRQDDHRRAMLAFVTVAATRKPVEQRLADIQRKLESMPRLVLTEIRTELF